MSKPKFLFLDITSECNLRCKQCHLWQSVDPEDSLALSERLRLVEELASWSPGATVVLSSGETMLKGEVFFALTSACQRAGLRCVANTNGSQLTEANMDRLLELGAGFQLSVSLDSHRPELHDWVRGRPGTFEAAVSGLQRLIAKRQSIRKEDRIHLLVSSILFDRNLSEVRDYVNFATNLGLDGITFQVLSPTFGNRGATDPFFEEHFPSDPEAWSEAMKTLQDMQDQGAAIKSSIHGLNAAREMVMLKASGQFPEFTTTQVCDSGERNLMVSQSGELLLCHFMRSLTGGRSVGNVRHATLQELWESDFATEVRKTMSGCMKSCGLLGCHRRETA